MRQVKVQDAVGTVLAHDMTRIVRGRFKGVAFKKGHVVREDDIPKLLEIGKQSLYVLDLGQDRLHEDDAALRIAAAISGAVVTGAEICNGLITDDFSPSIGKKILDAGCTLEKKAVVPDDAKMISSAVLELQALGCDLIITTGGLYMNCEVCHYPACSFGR